DPLPQEPGGAVVLVDLELRNARAQLARTAVRVLPVVGGLRTTSRADGLVHVEDGRLVAVIVRARERVRGVPVVRDPGYASTQHRVVAQRERLDEEVR